MTQPEDTSNLLLLQPEEKAFLKPISDIVHEILIKYRTTEITAENRDAVNELKNKDFKTLCKERKINTSRATQLAMCLLSEQWYCVYQTGATFGDWTGKDKKRPFILYSLTTSAAPEDSKELTLSEYPAFYELVQDSIEHYDTMTDTEYYSRQCNTLDIPTGSRFIDADSLDALLSIADAFVSIPGKFPQITSKRLEKLEFPLDKPNSTIWNLLAEDMKKGTEQQLDGQFRMNILVQRHGSKTEIPIYYAISFDDQPPGVTITKRLDPFDKFVYIAMGALYNAGNQIMSITQIYKAMGNNGSPSAKDVKKINQSITKMSSARISINNEQETAAYNAYQPFIYDASLLPLERCSAIVNGQLTDAAIHLFREPPMLSFAKGRGQITTIERKLLQAPVSKTDENLLIMDYLIDRISHAKTKNGPRKILYESIFERAHITTAMQRSRGAKKVIKILDHFKSAGYILDFKTTKGGDGIEIRL